MVLQVKLSTLNTCREFRSLTSLRRFFFRYPLALDRLTHALQRHSSPSGFDGFLWKRLNAVAARHVEQIFEITSLTRVPRHEAKVVVPTLHRFFDFLCAANSAQTTLNVLRSVSYLREASQFPSFFVCRFSIATGVPF